MFANIRLAAALALGAALVASSARADDARSSLKSGKPDIKSMGPLAFGPEGILFIGDPAGAAIFAIDTNDRTATGSGPLKVSGLDAKIAAALDTQPNQILITDMAVNKISGNAYFGVSRGKGPNAVPAVVKVDRSEKVEVMPLDNVKFAKAELAKPGRADVITQIGYINGRVYVAGLTSEEFSSKLRSIPFPFEGGDTGTGVEIYHGSHGRFETKSPIRTFTAFEINGQPNILAAYTCTPIVRIPIAELKPGTNVKGTTVAELGNMNKPLDMVVYQKDGKDYVLISNNARGLMKVALDNLAGVEPITKRIPDKAGLKYETIAAYKNRDQVQQLDRLDKDNVVMLLKNKEGGLDLETIPLP
jgi:hypothetical protein